MKFGAVPIATATGNTLAHGIDVGSGRFSKGRVLSVDDIQTLQLEGFTEVVVAQLSKDDMPENEAAEKIGAAFATENVIAKTASTGRVNLHSIDSGLLKVNAKKINAINAIDPSITVATLPDFAICQPNTMVATVKIIPFAAPYQSVDQAAKLAAGALKMHPFQPLQIGLIQTILPLTKDSVLQKTVEVTRQRVMAFGGRINVAAHCNHDADHLSLTLNAMLNLDLLIIFGASAVCDDQDVIPAAIRAIGGKVIRIGMPVDPGNLLVLGKKGKTTILGAPGCARSPKENGFDWVLARLFAGLKVTARDIIAMGVGGLLMEIPTRPSPRSANQSPRSANQSPRNKTSLENA